MKILAITGKLAYPAVVKAVSGHPDIDVLEVPCDVASLITPSELIRAWNASELSSSDYDSFSNHSSNHSSNFMPKYDFAVVSGFSKMNYARASAVLGFPVFRGPKQASDLPLIAELPLSAFSECEPADVSIEHLKRESAEKLIRENECMRMKVLAEIVDACSLPQNILKEKIGYFIRSGADMIDIGVSPDASDDSVYETVSFACAVSTVPVSADTVIPEQIAAALKAGADMILSLTDENMDAVRKLAGDVCAGKTFVVLPSAESRKARASDNDRNECGNGIKCGNLQRIQSLEQNISYARSLFGDSVRLIADPVLDPALMGLSDSLSDYQVFHMKNPEIPLFFGAGNVTELFDADSVGMNALLAALADDSGASVLFTPEASVKTKGSVSELRRASEMILLAKIRNTMPKDGGIDLLVLKEKREKPEIFRLDQFSGDWNSPGFSENMRIVFCDDSGPGKTNSWKPDASGSFMIGIFKRSELSYAFGSDFSADLQNPDELVIAAIHRNISNVSISNASISNTSINDYSSKSSGNKNVVTTAFCGKSSQEILRTILESGEFVSDLSHAAYLGRELEKAEICLKTGRSYAQDEDF